VENKLKSILNRKGLTLIEVILTLAVLGVVVTPLMGMFVTSQKINVESHNEYKAVQLAQKYMEEIKAMDILNISSLHLDSSNDSDKEHITGNVSSEGYDLHIYIDKVSGKASSPVSIEWDCKKEVSENVDIDIEGGYIKFNGSSEAGFIHKNIELTLKDLSSDINIKVRNKEKDKLTIYIVKDDYAANVNTLEGTVRVVETTSSVKPDNLLYDVKITVKKNGKEINTVTGTVIFRN